MAKLKIPDPEINHEFCRLAPEPQFLRVMAALTSNHVTLHLADLSRLGYKVGFTPQYCDMLALVHCAIMSRYKFITGTEANIPTRPRLYLPSRHTGAIRYLRVVQELQLRHTKECLDLSKRIQQDLGDIHLILNSCQPQKPLTLPSQ